MAFASCPIDTTLDRTEPSNVPRGKRFDGRVRLETVSTGLGSAADPRPKQLVGGAVGSSQRSAVEGRGAHWDPASYRVHSFTAHNAMIVPFGRAGCRRPVWHVEIQPWRMTQLSGGLTKRQHFVPKTYLRGWSKDRWSKKSRGAPTIRAHFKLELKSENRNPDSILYEKWFYEEDPQSPNNELEKLFGQHETNWPRYMGCIDGAIESAIEIYDTNPNSKDSGESLNQYVMRTLVSLLNALPQYSECIKVFAAISYFRTPAALERKISELKDDPRAKEVLSHSKQNAWWLATNALTSTLIERFKSLNIKLLVAMDGSFVTCDNPCFDVDIADKDCAPLLGYDIGRLGTVVACFPLSSRVVALLLPSKLMLDNKPVAIPKHDALCLTRRGVNLFNAGVLRVARDLIVSTADYQELVDIDSSWSKLTT